MVHAVGKNQLNPTPINYHVPLVCINHLCFGMFHESILLFFMSSASFVRYKLVGQLQHTCSLSRRSKISFEVTPSNFRRNLWVLKSQVFFFVSHFQIIVIDQALANAQAYRHCKSLALGSSIWWSILSSTYEAIGSTVAFINMSSKLKLILVICSIWTSIDKGN